MSDFTLPDYAPTYPISKSVKPRQRTVKLPDWGTEQRATVGQNQTSPEWTIKWILRPAHADILDEFLAERARRGEWFLWTPPGGTLGRYRCDSWSKLVSSSAVREVQATFRQVYSYERPVELIAALQAGTFIASFGEVYSFYAPLVSEDPYAEHVSLLLHMDGTNASTTFTDSSYNKLAAVPDGSAQISTTQNKFGGASGVFNGTNSSLTIAPSSAFAFGTGDFTVELWAYQSATPNGGALISEQYTGTGDSVALAIGFCDGGVGNATGSRPFLGLFNGTAWIGAVAASALANSQWHHIAAVRFGNAWNLYVNGTSVASFTDNSAVLRDELVYIGRRWNTGGTTSFFNGSIDDVRITKGVARYTANFTAPTAAFVNPTVVPVDPYAENVSLLLHMDGTNGSTTITDSSPTPKTVTANGNAQISTAQSKFGGSSIAFDGNGDWITAPANPAFSFGTGDFTVELFARWNSFANVNVIFDTRNGGASSNGIVFYTTSAGVFTVYRGLTALITGATLQTGQWYHIAVSRAAGTTRLFVDGVQSGSSASDSATYTDQNFFAGKTNEALSNYFNGYIDDLRITKGVARYTANFTPPTAAFPNPIDAYADNVSLLLHMDGTSGGNTFINTSSSALAVTAAGNTQLSTTQKKFGITSAYFDGSGDSLDFPEISLAGDFTIECWIYPVSTADMNVLGGSTSNNQALRINFSGTAGRTIMYSEAFIIDANNAVVANQWQHVAITRSGSNTRLFVDGVQKGTTNTTWTGTFRLQVVGRLKVDGAYYTPSYDYNGYLDELRVTTGVARYTANFTAPTAAFPSPAIDPYAASVSLLLRMNGANTSTTFTDSSSNALTVSAFGNAQNSTVQNRFGGASGLFDGNGDYLSVAYNAALDLIGGLFTIETWIYPTAYKAGGMRVCALGGGTPAFNSTTGLHLLIQLGDNNGTVSVQWWNGSAGTGTGTVAAAPLNTWSHLAVSVSGTNIHVAVNGVVQVFTSSTLVRPSTNPTFTVATIPGEAGLSTYAFVGYMDDFRITKGVARYTANFTPPAAQHPLPSVTVTDPYRANTSLLLHMNGANNSTAFVDNSINGLTITPAGNAQISTAQSKFGGASALFDGSGDFLSTPYTSLFSFLTGNFTIEAWVYVTSSTDESSIACTYTTYNSGTGFLLDVDVTRLPRFFSGTSSGVTIVSTIAVALNTWAHIAVCRASGTTRLFVNGVIGGSSTTVTNMDGTGSSNLYVGTLGTMGANQFAGYIDELRITKGVARYTANFTPPTAAFPDA